MFFSTLDCPINFRLFFEQKPPDQHKANGRTTLYLSLARGCGAAAGGGEVHYAFMWCRPSAHKRFTPSRDGRLPLLIPDIAAARHTNIRTPTISAALTAHDGLT